MVYSHWNLKESPFAGHLDPRWFYAGTSDEESLARLHFLVDQPRRLGLLLGESGIGKTMLLEVFARQIRSQSRAVVQLSLLGITPADLLWQITDRLGTDPEPRESLFLLWRSLGERLREYWYQRTSTVLLLDDADEASEEVLQQVARIAQLEPSPRARISIILAAQGRRMGRLGRRLLELTDLRIDLEPWTEAETMDYLPTALKLAGCTRPVFTDDARRTIFELTSGIPRRVKQLADLALVAGAGGELQEIDAPTIHSVFQELGVAVLSAH